MQICGIVAEFNPFHNGHSYIINKIKDENNCVLAVMSGNYVQRGEPALFDKFTRTKAALSEGVDLVIELPSPWACSCAQNFSFGAVSLLKECKVDKIAFGSELGNSKLLTEIAKTDLDLKIDKTSLKSGQTYAQIRQKLLCDLLGKECEDVLEGANNNLGIEYIKSCILQNFSPVIETIERSGATHDSLQTCDNIASATYLRKQINNGIFPISFIPESGVLLYENCINTGKFLDYKLFQKLTITQLRRINDFSKLPDISEGLDNKIKNEIRNTGTYQELLEAIKSKRYTLARIRRIILAAFLDIDSQYFLKPVPYINVLGFSKKGEIALKQIANTTSLPIIISCKASKTLDNETEILLNNECRRNDIYMSMLYTPEPCGSDYTNGIIKKGD